MAIDFTEARWGRDKEDVAACRFRIEAWDMVSGRDWIVAGGLAYDDAEALRQQTVNDSIDAGHRWMVEVAQEGKAAVVTEDSE